MHYAPSHDHPMCTALASRERVVPPDPGAPPYPCAPRAAARHTNTFLDPHMIMSRLRITIEP